MLVIVRGEGGSLVAKLSHDSPLSGPASQVALVERRSVTVGKTLTLRPGRYALDAPCRTA